MSGALLDTSILIQDVEPAGLGMQETAAISVISLGELRAGVRLARDISMRASRQARLTAIRDAFSPLPVDENVAEHYGDVLAAARTAGRITKATDLLIIATAAATGRVLWTRDERQAALAREVGVVVGGGER